MARPIHDLNDFIEDAAQAISKEYERIQRRVLEDPGTAGDQGEENWAELLRKWLPEKYKIVTKGRIISESGEVSPQVDILVLDASYPPLLAESLKLYLAEGVVAAFECKVTLKSSHIREAVETSVIIKRLTKRRRGTPRKELNSRIKYGLLAHSHSWKNPEKTLEKNLSDAITEFPEHPREMIDLICVSNLGCWVIARILDVASNNKRDHAVGLWFMSSDDSAKAITIYGKNLSESKNMKKGSSIGFMLTRLYEMMAWDDKEMRWLSSYFGKAIGDVANMGIPRIWRGEIFTSEVDSKLSEGGLIYAPWDEWNVFI